MSRSLTRFCSSDHDTGAGIASNVFPWDYRNMYTVYVCIYMYVCMYVFDEPHAPCRGRKNKSQRQTLIPQHRRIVIARATYLEVQGFGLLTCDIRYWSPCISIVTVVYTCQRSCSTCSGFCIQKPRKAQRGGLHFMKIEEHTKSLDQTSETTGFRAFVPLAKALIPKPWTRFGVSSSSCSTTRSFRVSAALPKIRSNARTRLKRHVICKLRIK